MDPRADETIWQDHSSQWINIIPFVLCILILPIPWAIYRYLKVRCTSYTLGVQRLRLSRGILNRSYDDLELYRVKDTSLTRPFLQRLVGLGTVTLITSDASHPTLTIPAITDAHRVHDVIRDQVETMRRERGVREFDVT